jgi:hypothetical protein
MLRSMRWFNAGFTLETLSRHRSSFLLPDAPDASYTRFVPAHFKEA